MITEAKAIEINRSGDLSQYSHDELREADAFIKTFALKTFEHHLNPLPQWAQGVLRNWARAHFGSVEVDNLMIELNCYPLWMKQS